MDSEDRRVAVVTGASGGIGGACARQLALDGASVVLLDIQTDGADRVAEEIRERRGAASVFACDITDEESLAVVQKQIAQTVGACDILVNSAGIVRDQLFVRMKRGDFEDVLEANLTGAFLATKAFVGGMLRGRWGRIVNISSSAALTGQIGQANYSASKAGLIGMTRTCALEFSRRGVTVNAIAPGFIETPMTEKLADGIREDAIRRTPMGRFGRPPEVAALVSFLCSESAGYITGEVIRIDGGLAM